MNVIDPRQADVELRAVTKRFGGTTAVDHVDLALGTGVTGLLGPNGAGKTTLLRMVATSLRPDGGEVRLLGQDPWAGHDEVTSVRRRLGYLPQEVGAPRDMTAYGFVEYVAVLKEWNQPRTRAREVRRVLELVDLGDLAAKKVRKLSGGQRRRVALAQALLGDPAVLVLDEPTTGLDPAQRANLRRTLSVVGAQSTVLLSTHQTEDVAALCERVVVMERGHVLFDGTVRDMVRTAEGQVWLSDAPPVEAVASWRTGTGRHRVVGGPRPADAEAVEPSLEDAYLLMLQQPLPGRSSPDAATTAAPT